MVVVEKNGKVVARAILRLTKVNEAASKLNNDLGFVDVEDVDKLSSNSTKTVGGERLVLFLERFYTTFTGEQRSKLVKEVFSLVKEKSLQMEIDLVLSGGYSELKLESETMKLPIFISRSKNGMQYLDSLGGESDASDGGSYHSADVLVVQ